MARWRDREILRHVTSAMVVLVCGTIASASDSPAQDPAAIRAELAMARRLPPELVSALQPVIDRVWSGFDEGAAQKQVEFATRYWRLPGNAGYDATLDRVRDRLIAAGVKDAGTLAPAPSSAAALWVETAPAPSRGWDHTVGTLALIREGRQELVVLSRNRERLALCINSFSTTGRTEAAVIDVGRGDRAEDYANKEVKGAVVLGDADVGTLFRQAVTQRGALGVISTALAQYINPDPPGAKPRPRDKWDILQWGSIPYDEARKSFGFKASPRAAATLRNALAAGPQRVRVEIASTFANKPERTLVAEIPGRSLPHERIVIAAHVQEPGANDNASGVATLMELARSLARGIAAGQIPAPERTITFLWLNEIGGSRAWLKVHADQVAGVRYMFSMDMTGEDVAKTGGSFLVERWPDPGAVWARPWDPHSEWGAGNTKAADLKGDLINDLHLAVCEQVAKKSKWVVSTNPYEGGSDHTVFGEAGIPSLLNWHFTDRYYHSNMDTADKTSAAEMRNVGVAVAASAWFMASADEAQSLAVAELVANAGRARVAIESRDGATLLDHAAALMAWRKWSAEAVKSVLRLVTRPSETPFFQRLDQLAAPFVTAVGGR